MGLPRSPWDTTAKYRSTSKTYSVVTRFDGVISENYTLQYDFDMIDQRPIYGKGVIVTLPGGTKHKKATAYVRRSWEMVVLSPAVTGGYGTSPYFTGASLTKERNGHPDLTYLLWTFDPTFRSGPEVEMKNEAATKALNKLADQKINLGENLATFGQTLAMFMSRVDFLKAALNLGRQTKDWRQFLKLSTLDLREKGPLSKAASSYLEYIYGLKPLVDDVYTAHKLLKNHAEAPLLLKAVGKAQRTVEKTIGFTLPNSSVTKDSVTSDSKLTCTVWAYVDPEWKGVRALQQFGLVNPVALAWELVPYSFVVDWFLPIGPVLYALTAPMGLVFVDGYYSFRNSEVTNISYAATGYPMNEGNGVITSRFDGKAKMVYEGFTRELLGYWPIPGLWIASDPFKKDRPLKALALGISLLSGSKPPIR